MEMNDSYRLAPPGVFLSPRRSWRYLHGAVFGLALACTMALRPAWGAEALLWLEQGRPNAVALQAVATLVRAADDGLDPRDYQADRLSAALALLADGPPLPAESAARLDGELTLALQRYLTDLHAGRVDPRAIHADYRVARPVPLDTAALLRDAVVRQRLPQALREAAPPVPLYPALRRTLAQYRTLAALPFWDGPLPPLPGRKLEPGQAWDGLELLIRRLGALGDLATDTPVPLLFEGALVEGVRAFQARHGIEPDGLIGRETMAQLAVSPAQRVRQIELTMERLRWTPLLQGPRMVVVNVPEFVLRAYEWRDGRVQVRLETRVIVGKAFKTRTPVFDELMRLIEFSPYWNVPPSIARAELVPRLRRDPGYFAAEGFEFVGGGQVSTELTSANLDAVLRGKMRIRQRPGPKNALGRIKFVFPNNDNIYLHDTSAPQLFQRARRDFSHGCIRVEQPLALAQFVLQDAPDWPAARIQAAMAAGTSSTLRLKEPLPVVIAYSTVVVRGGRVYFYPDLYGHDGTLDLALRQRALPASASRPAQGTAQ